MRGQPTAGPEAELLRHAFRSFDEAAAALQGSYQALSARVAQLDVDLAVSNEALRCNLQEKEDMRRHLAAILESLATGVIVADRTDTIVQCNRAAETLLDMRRMDMLGRSRTNCLQAAKLDGRQYPLMGPTGAFLSLTETSLRDADDRSTGAIVLIQDVSVVRGLEERVQRRDRLAAMGEMVGRIAHEIRNPLGSIELFASMLRQDLAQDPQRRRYTEHISMAVQAMDRLLANLLLYTKPDCRRAASHPVTPLVHEALALASSALVRRGIQVAVHVEPPLESLWCDAPQMKQALVNLFLNAAEAMPDGGRLTVAACPDAIGGGPPLVRMVISDTGTGIAPGHLARVFDPFFTTRDEGTGLGLAIVHGIIEGHGGRIEVDSAVGSGTTFTLMLPAGPARTGDKEEP